MANNWFSFKQFTVNQEKSAFKVGTDAVLLGAAAGIDGVKKILDNGTGTGVIAIMLAQRSNADQGLYRRCGNFDNMDAS